MSDVQRMLSDAALACDDNWYGYNCANKCGLCKSFGCNKVTGECINGCVNNLKIFYLPPLCHIGLDKLTEPEIVSITSTSIRIKHPIVWKEEYEKIRITYSCAITGENDYIFTQSWNRLFQNMTYLIGYFNKLNPGSVYSVKCMLLAENEIIESKWQSVETDCELFHQLRLLPSFNPTLGSRAWFESVPFLRLLSWNLTNVEQLDDTIYFLRSEKIERILRAKKL
ncbi:uncharacterized protein LOC109862587 [Pseudomyrmex gracilis]|uniref:uncharacterized protein LOC109862587 n=1 Tax=Pseudomyrmex gracilis TaxID=219809 RepID=UPI00099560C4|nr:uncharacterized protein LOC109862587 [Pseudomyrmex gracilis]